MSILSPQKARMYTKMHAQPGQSLSPCDHAGLCHGVTSIAKGSSVTSVVGVKFVIKCTVCGHAFSRKTINLILPTHKDRHGNQCPGSTGYYTGYSS